MEKNSLHKSILKTLAYADIFDSLLTEGEIWQFLISDIKVSKQEVGQAIKKLKIIESKKGFYCLEKRTGIIEKRIKRKIYSEKKIYIAQRVSTYLSYLPTVYLIGVSGGLAVANADEKDDIDFFVVAKKNTLWLTRFLALLILEILGVRRKRKEMLVSDKICLNMLLDERNLFLPKEQQNLYTAHEVLQMMPLFERSNTYQKFLQANVWVGKFLPNAITGIRNKESKIMEEKKNPLFIIRYSLLILEFLAKKAQLWYMRKYRSNKMVTDTLIAFYPLDYHKKVLKQFESRLKKYNVL